MLWSFIKKGFEGFKNPFFFRFDFFLFKQISIGSRSRFRFIFSSFNKWVLRSIFFLKFLFQSSRDTTIVTERFIDKQIKLRGSIFFPFLIYSSINDFKGMSGNRAFSNAVRIYTVLCKKGIIHERNNYLLWGYRVTIIISIKFFHGDFSISQMRSGDQSPMV